MINRYDEFPELLNKLNEYSTLFNELNKTTYHNLQNTKKLKDFFQTRPSDMYSAIKKLKIELYTYQLTLEEIINKINEFNEGNNNEQI